MQTDPVPALSPERVRFLLQSLFWPSSCIDDELIESAREWLPSVSGPKPGGAWRDQHTWRVGVARVTTPGWGPLRWASVSCDQCGQSCGHAAAALLVAAWADPGSRAWFTDPMWLVRLRPLLAPRPKAVEARSPAARPPISRDGKLRYLLSEHRDGSLLPLRVGRQIIKYDKATGVRELKPTNAPESIEKLEERCHLTNADYAVAEALGRYNALRSLAHLSFGPPQPGLGALIEDQELALIDALSGVSDARWMGEPVTVSPEPVRPTLRLDPGDGWHALAWDPPIAGRIGLSYAIVDEGDGRLVLRPIARDVPEALRAALDRPLCDVPDDEIDEFLDVAVVEHQLPVRIPPGVGRFREATDRSARLLLAQEGESIVVAPQVVYRHGLDVAEVPPSPEEPFVGVGGVRCARDREWEEAIVARATVDLGAVPLVLDPEAALEFLAERLPALQQAWVVCGDQNLVRRYRGKAKPQVSLRAGIDWFDLKIRYMVDGIELPAKAVIESWRAGRKFLVLDDGSFFRLPDEWLERLGREAEEAASWGDRKLGAHHAAAIPGLLDEAGEEARDWGEVARQITDFDHIPDREIPPGVMATLRPYQAEGFRWLAFLRDHGLGGCLADDMGLGKTLQVLTVLADTHLRASDEEPLPSLVVAPVSVLRNWQREAARFVPGLRVYVHHGEERRQEWPDCDVVLTSYALVRLENERFAARRWRYVVLDEAQNVKNANSAGAAAVKALDARHRLALTGTPMENRLAELWSLFDFLMPGFFGSPIAFGRLYAGPIERELDKDAAARLRTRLRPFLLRRLKSEVAKDLPARQVGLLRCELSPAERELYARVRETYRQQVLAAVNERGMGKASILVLEALTRLRQACCHPELLPFPEARAVEGSSKVAALLEALGQAVEEGHKCLVFSQWPSLLRLVSRELDQAGVAHLYLDGQTQDRQALVDRFQRPDGPPVFLISIKAGGAGLTLTAADHVFHLDPWWNPAVEDQATDRAHRIGQTRPVIVHRIVATDTVEDKVLELQERKRWLFEATIQADGALVSQLTKEDLEAVFTA